MYKAVFPTRTVYYQATSSFCAAHCCWLRTDYCCRLLWSNADGSCFSIPRSLTLSLSLSRSLLPCSQSRPSTLSQPVRLSPLTVVCALPDCFLHKFILPLSTSMCHDIVLASCILLCYSRTLHHKLWTSPPQTVNSLDFIYDLDSFVFMEPAGQGD